MDGLSMGDSSRKPIAESGRFVSSHDKLEKNDRPGATWYLSRRDIEENSPSRRDNIDLKKETYLRKSYCTFLQDLGMKLKVPQVTIATAIIFCHRFFLRQSHAKNDRRTVATVCMFLAGKVEETPRPLKDVILVSYEIIHKKDPAAVQRIKQKEVYEQQKELTLLGERVVLATLGFDLNVHHPYKPLVASIKKFKVAQNALAQVAWNFVNDGLRTSLCLQFKPHHIAAGAIFLAAKFLKVKLPSDGEKVWWQEFDVTPRQLEEVSNQMLELYEQNRATPTHGNETEGSSGANHRATAKTHSSADESTIQNGHPNSATVAKHNNKASASRSSVDHTHTDVQNITHRNAQNEGSDHRGKEVKTATRDDTSIDNGKDRWHHVSSNASEALTSKAGHAPERHVEDPMSDRSGKTDGKEWSSSHSEVPRGYSPKVTINKDKLKAALEKRRKSLPDVSRKIDLMNDDDLIERELENGVELAAGGKVKQEKSHSWTKPLYDAKNGSNSLVETAEEGELSLDNCEFQSPEHGKRKRKISSPLKQIDGKEGYELPVRQLPYSKHRDVLDDGMVTG